MRDQVFNLKHVKSEKSVGREANFHSTLGDTGVTFPLSGVLETPSEPEPREADGRAGGTTQELSDLGKVTSTLVHPHLCTGAIKHARGDITSIQGPVCMAINSHMGLKMASLLLQPLIHWGGLIKGVCWLLCDETQHIY